MAAFDLGLAAGADGLEMDVHLSRDGVVVVCHDATLDRTTDATGPVAARTAAELSRVDAGFRYRDNGDYPFRGRGIGIPSLRDVLRRYPDIPMIVEMKVDRPEMGLALAAEVTVASAVDRVCVASSGCRALRTAREALPGLATSACRWDVRLALYRSRVGWPVRRAAYGGYQVPEVSGATRIVSREFIRHAHEAGLEVQVWTVDDESDMERLLSWGADGLITNRPDAAAAVRNRFAAGSPQPAGRVGRGLQPARRQ
jgi:glycerophosphoryl diester phosphodiesterase